MFTFPEIEKRGHTQNISYHETTTTTKDVLEEIAETNLLYA